MDFKKDLSEDTERFKEHINAFGNTAGGGLFVFGVNRDFTLSEETLEQEPIIKKIVSLANDSQVPPLRALVHHLQVQDKVLLGIEIPVCSQLPVFIRSRDPWKNGAFKRSGSSTLPMTEQEIRTHMARSQNYSVDSEVVETADVSELDLDALAAALSGFKKEIGLNPPNLQVLADNQVVALAGGRYQPTLAGWLMFSKNPQSVRPLRNASIELQIFKGNTRDESIRKHEIVGSLPKQVETTIEVMMQHVWKIPKLQGIKREEIHAYDQVTLREVVTNAVVHRDYQQLHQPVKAAIFSDRIEVENPGGLMPGLTTYNLIHKRAWRNENIATLMTKVGLGEMDGQGIDRIYAATRRLKVPAPVFYNENRSFKIVLSAPKDYEDYTSLEKRLTVIVLLLHENEIGNESLRNVFSIDVGKASTLLKLLVEGGIVRRTTPSMKFAKYKLTEEFHQKLWS